MMWRNLAKLVLVAAVAWILLSTVSCGQGNVYVGVGVAGPYAGYPYGGYPYPVGGVVVGRPIYP